MEKFFVIPPINHMDLATYNNYNCVYCLAHLCLEEKNKNYKQYKQYFIDKSKQGYHVILDNSAAEADLVTCKVLIDLTKQIMPTEVIAPDHLYDEYKTKKELLAFYNLMVKNDLIGKVKIHAVPQGNSIQSFLRSYLFMINCSYVDVIGLSKLTIPKCFCELTDSNSVSVNRRYLVNLLNSLDLIQKPVHLLGMRNITEYKAYKGIKNIRSTDSCWTVLSAICNIKLDKNLVLDTVNDTPHNYFFMNINDQQIKLALHNINQMRDIIEQTKWK